MRIIAAFIVCLLVVGPAAPAQEPAADAGHPRLLAAGDGHSLWVIEQLGNNEHRLLHRNGAAAQGEIHRANKSKGRPIALAAGAGIGYVVYGDGTAQSVRFWIDEPTQTPRYDIRQLPPLPCGGQFVDIAATSRSPVLLLRLKPSPAERQADPPDADGADAAPESTSTSESDDPSAPDVESNGSATPDAAATDSPEEPEGPFVVYRLTAGRWQPIADSPDGMNRSAAPRLAVVGSDQRIHLVVPAENGSVLTVHRFDGETWHAAVYARKVSNAFEVITPMTLCVVVDQIDETQFGCAILRKGTVLDGGTIAVPPADDGDLAATIYNGHPAIVSISPGGDRLSVHYRDLTEPPSVDAESLDLAITPWPAPAVNRDMVMFALLVVMTVFILATWRRDPKTVIVELPESMRPAEITRRIAAGAIDLLPPMLAVMVLFGLVDPGAVVGAWPAPTGDWSTMIPGFLVIVLFAIHTAVTEAFTGTSLGKRLLGLRVVTVKGQPPNIWQILVRNLLKIVELIGWFLLLFMFLNPAHQRMGDLAARTVVVRDADADDSQTEDE